MKRFLTAVLCPLILFSLVTSVGAAPWKAGTATEDGVPAVLNPATPRDGTRVLKAREAWRLGADEVHDPLLGRVTDVLTDANGNSYVLDGDLSQIHVVDRDGRLLRTIGREGDGPGEIRNADQLIQLPGGDIGVLEMMPGGVVVIDPMGEPREGFHPGGEGGDFMMFPGHIEADDQGIVLGRVATSMTDAAVVTTYSLARYARGGAPLVSFFSLREEQKGDEISLSMGEEKDAFTRQWTLLPDGGVVVFSDSFDYRLRLYGADGSPRGIIRRDYDTLKRTPEDLAAARKQAAEMQERFQGVRQEVEERERDISSVVARPDGSLWVANSAGDRARPDGVGLLDVFDPQGRYTHTLRIEGVDFDPGRDRYLIDGDRLYVLREALKLPPRTMSSGGGGMQMMMIQTTDTGEDKDDEEAGPHQVVCYDLAS